MLYLIIGLLMFCIGLVLFILGYIGKYELEKSGYMDEADLTNISKEKEALTQKVEEADKMLSELNKFSTYVSKELETKHKDLLFLYQLIDEKQEKLKNIEQSEITIEKKEVKAKKVKKEDGLENNNEKDKKETKKRNKPKEANDYSTINQELVIKNIIKSNISVPEKVKALYKEGKSAEEIAKLLKKGKGEIRLMIDMGKKE